MVAAVALAAPAVASNTARDESSFVTDELETVVADTLTALGVDSEVVDALTDAAVREASERLGTLREDGSFTDDQLATLNKRTHDGTLHEQVAASIADIRTRLAAVRDAAKERLAKIGARLEDDRAVRDALLDHGIDPSTVIADLLDSLPIVPPATPPPTDTAPAPSYPTPEPGPAPTYPTYPTPEPGPAPTYPTIRLANNGWPDWL